MATENGDDLILPIQNSGADEVDLSGFTGVVVNVDQAKAVTLTGDGLAIDDTASKVRALEGDVDNAHLLADAATVTAKEADFDDAIHFLKRTGCMITRRRTKD